MSNKRKQLIITPAIQYKFILLILLSISVPVIVVCFYTFSIINSIITELQPSSEIIQNAIKLSLRNLGIIMFGGFTTLSILLIYWCTLFSNRVVGPIYRLEQDLEAMVQNKKISKIKFRKDDAFQSLADKINLLLESKDSE